MLEDKVRAANPLELFLALGEVRTVRGAERIYRAEQRGQNRPEVLRAAARRVEELRGGEAVKKPKLAAKGVIVEAVGRGKRHPGW